MSDNHEYGTEVDIDEVWSALAPTSQLRLALEILMGNLPPHAETEAIRDAITEIHKWLCAEELRELRIFGISRQYTIIRPLNMRDLPDDDTMQKIAGAVQTLTDLGLIAGPGDL